MEGAGVDHTVIIAATDNHQTGAEPEYPIGLRSPIVGIARVTGFTFKGNTGDLGAIWAAGQAGGYFRVDHNRFDNPSGRAITAFSGKGVIDHNIFDMISQATQVKFGSYGGGSWGDNSWSGPLSLGTDNAIYFEDNVFNWNAGGGYLAANDCYSGGRVVFRHNTLNGSYLTNHGADSSGRERGCFSYEVYQNTMTATNNWYAAMQFRGGTGVIFDNTANGYDTFVELAAYRVNEYMAPWGICDGTGPYDGNLPGMNGYPCVDQPGRSTDSGLGTSQSLEPVYEWNNLLNGNNTGIWTRSPSYIAAGRDFYSDTPRPGYTPYPYPHPIIATVPKPPSSLTITTK